MKINYKGKHWFASNKNERPTLQIFDILLCVYQPRENIYMNKYTGISSTEHNNVHLIEYRIITVSVNVMCWLYPTIDKDLILSYLSATYMRQWIE